MCQSQILGIAPKDFDIEVYNLDAKTLGDILAKFGKVSMVGSSFGIIKLTSPDGLDFDFSLPRRENKIGKGHKGFMVEVDPIMTPKKVRPGEILLLILSVKTHSQEKSKTSLVESKT